MNRFAAIACFLFMWMVVICQAIAEPMEDCVNKETPVTLGLFLAALAATAAFVWKFARIHTTTQTRLDRLEKKIERIWQKLDVEK
jgi:membrane protein implicated in regulation of membrane protease activity